VQQSEQRNEKRVTSTANQDSEVGDKKESLISRPHALRHVDQKIMDGPGYPLA
jgi:hypothetical protein